MDVSVSSIFLVEATTYETPMITQSTIDCYDNFETGSHFEKILSNTEYTNVIEQAQYRVLILFLF